MKIISEDPMPDDATAKTVEANKSLCKMETELRLKLTHSTRYSPVVNRTEQCINMVNVAINIVNQYG